MDNINLGTPDGTRDIIFEEASLYRQISDRLSFVFEKNGFRRVMTPAIEYFGVFDADKSLRQENMYKLTDRNGRLAALRADNTTPMARVAASKLRLQGLPQKIYYNQNIYRINSGWSGRRSEILQSGVEFIGATGIKSDLVCLGAAMEAMSDLGLEFKLELGHVGYYNAMIKELKLGENEIKKLRSYVERKNIGKITRYDKISKIPLLYGGAEVFARAYALAGENAEAAEALSYVRRLYDLLCGAGFGERVMIDMGIVHEIDYYTGAVFRGYIDGAGEPALTGGRYDNLMACFGEDCPATGFAINVSLIADALKRDALPRYEGPEYIIHFEPDSFGEAEKLRLELEKKGVKCEYSSFDKLSGTLKWAAERGARHVAYTAEGKTEVFDIKNPAAEVT